MSGSGLLGLNLHFEQHPEHLGNRIFDPSQTGDQARMARKFKAWFNARGVEVRTLDMVDFDDPALDHVVYFDFFWREYRGNPYLSRIPRQKRALVMIEPPNVNPLLYYVPFFRRQFATVFTFNRRLIACEGCTPINNPMLGADEAIPAYAARRDVEVPWERKKLLGTITGNRWAYMPTSNFRRRAEVFAWFDRNWPDDFDLWGRGWNRPMGPVQRWFGHRTYRTYRGEVPDDVDGKILAMARYKFYLCLENNIHESGFVTDRITDALCARTVPVYHGPTTMGDHVPPECFINYREFAGPADLGRFLRSIDEARYRRYLDAGQAFLESNATRFFTTYYMFRVIHDRLLAPAGRL